MIFGEEPPLGYKGLIAPRIDRQKIPYLSGMRSLAAGAMAFLHQGNHAAATRIFDHFDAYLSNDAMPFRGFPQDWDPCTGQPLARR